MKSINLFFLLSSQTFPKASNSSSWNFLSLAFHVLGFSVALENPFHSVPPVKTLTFSCRKKNTFKFISKFYDTLKVKAEKRETCCLIKHCSAFWFFWHGTENIHPGKRIAVAAKTYFLPFRNQRKITCSTPILNL